MTNHLHHQRRTLAKLRRTAANVLAQIGQCQQGDAHALQKLQQLQPKQGDLCDLLMKMGQFYIKVCAAERQLVKILEETANENTAQAELTEVDKQILRQFLERQ